MVLKCCSIAKCALIKKENKMKKWMMMLAVAGIAVASLASSNDELSNIAPVAVKKVYFQIENQKIMMYTQMVFLNENKAQTVLLKEATFKLDLKAENKNGALTPCIDFECRCKDEVPGSGRKSADISVALGKGMRAMGDAGKRAPMVLPPGASLHCIKTEFADATPASLAEMIKLTNAFGDPDYNITLTMNGKADVGRYRLPGKPASGSVFTSELEFIDLQMQTTREGGVNPDMDKYETHAVLAKYGPELRELGRFLFVVQ
jgi:hypothetical protein